MNAEPLYETLYLIRRFEEIVLEEFPKGRFAGTTHTYLGQEANAVGVLSNLAEEDIVVSNHRCHGHFLAYGGDPRSLFAELMGRETGVSGGRGGSQHLHWRNFYSNGVLGGTVPLATGMALAEKQKKTGSITIVFLGDGALGEGVVYESLNLASLWSVPILYVLENNQIAQTTPIEKHLAGNLNTRFQSFGIPVCERDTSDVLEIRSAAQISMDDVRKSQFPRALILHTARFGPHSKGDDTRPAEVIEILRRERDPLNIHGKRIDSSKREQIQKRIDEQLQVSFNQAFEDPILE